MISEISNLRRIYESDSSKLTQEEEKAKLHYILELVVNVDEIFRE